MAKIAILGSGPAGLFAALKLKDHAEVHIFERGKSFKDRLSDTNPSVTEGFSGASLWSDGKLTLHPRVGSSQTLIDLYGDLFISSKVQEVDKMYLDLGAPQGHIKTAEYPEEFKRKCRQAGFNLIDRSAVRHIGSDGGPIIAQNMLDLFNGKVEIFTDVEINPTLWENGKGQIEVSGYFTQRDHHFSEVYDYVIVAVGRSGASWIKDLYNNSNLPYSPGITDVGVRIECDQGVFEEFYTKYSFEPKLSKVSSFGERVRTFCSCLREGQIALEKYDHIVDANDKPLICVNGHSYSEDNKGYKPSGNSNLAILVSAKFTEPFKDSLGYCQSIGKLANTLSGGGLILQSYRDFKKQRRSTNDRIRESGVIPSLKEGWAAGDLSFCIPYRIMYSISEFIDGLECLFPGIQNCLMYGLELKLYSNEALVDGTELNYRGHRNIFAAGDGSGLTRSLSMASLHGLLVAEKIIERMQNGGNNSVG